MFTSVNGMIVKVMIVHFHFPTAKVGMLVAGTKKIWARWMMVIPVIVSEDAVTTLTPLKGSK
jgi:hypothetical protein